MWSSNFVCNHKTVLLALYFIRFILSIGWMWHMLVISLKKQVILFPQGSTVLDVPAFPEKL